MEVVAFRKAGLFEEINSLFAAGILGDSLGTLRHSMFGQLSREVKSDSSLDFPAGDGVLLVVVSQFGGLSGNSFKDIINKRVHDAHGLGGDTSVGVDLLEDLVDVDRVALLAGLSPGLLFSSRLALDGSLLLSFLGSNLSGHYGVS